jgi:hypothetical protein
MGPRFGSDMFFVTHSWMGPEGDPGMPRLIEIHKALLGSEPHTAFVTSGRDTVQMLAQAVEKAGAAEGAAVARALEEVELDLLTGKLDYRPAADAAASPHLLLAAILATGLAGIEQGSATPEATAEDLSLLTPEALAARGPRRLPQSLTDALKEP